MTKEAFKKIFGEAVIQSCRTRLEGMSSQKRAEFVHFCALVVTTYRHMINEGNQ